MRCLSMRVGFFAAGLAVTLILGLSACGLNVVNPQADAAARRIYTTVQAGGDLSRDAEIAPQMRTPAGLAQFNAARELMPKGAAQTVESRGWRFTSTPQGGAARLVHAYLYADCTVVAETVLQKPPGSQVWLVVGFHVRREAATQEPNPFAPDPALRPEQT